MSIYVDSNHDNHKLSVDSEEHFPFPSGLCLSTSDYAKLVMLY